MWRFFWKFNSLKNHAARQSFKQIIECHNRLNTIGVHVFLQAVRRDDYCLDGLARLGFAAERINLIPQNLIEIFVNSVFIDWEFHFADADDTVASVNQKVNLCAASGSILSIFSLENQEDTSHCTPLTPMLFLICSIWQRQSCSKVYPAQARRDGKSMLFDQKCGSWP